MTLSEKEKMFPHLIAALIDEAYRLGYTVAFGEAYRSPEEAARDAAEGKGIRNSLHTLRIAIDLMLYKDGEYLTKSEDYKPAGDFWKSLSEKGSFECCWGGDFHRADGNHFSLEHNGVR